MGGACGCLVESGSVSSTFLSPSFCEEFRGLPAIECKNNLFCFIYLCSLFFYCEHLDCAAARWANSVVQRRWMDLQDLVLRVQLGNIKYLYMSKYYGCPAVYWLFPDHTGVGGVGNQSRAVPISSKWGFAMSFITSSLFSLLFFFSLLLLKVVHLKWAEAWKHTFVLSFLPCFLRPL